MSKVVKDGMVAVLVSPGYGSGWYTCNHEEDMLFDAGLVDLVLNEADKDKWFDYAESKWPEAYCGGVEQLEVQWVPKGSIFRIEEYDGSESLIFKEDITFIKA